MPSSPVSPKSAALVATVAVAFALALSGCGVAATEPDDAGESEPTGSTDEAFSIYEMHPELAPNLRLSNLTMAPNCREAWVDITYTPSALGTHSLFPPAPVPRIVIRGRSWDMSGATSPSAFSVIHSALGGTQRVHIGAPGITPSGPRMRYAAYVDAAYGELYTTDNYIRGEFTCTP